MADKQLIRELDKRLDDLRIKHQEELEALAGYDELRARHTQELDDLYEEVTQEVRTADALHAVH